MEKEVEVPMVLRQEVIVETPQLVVAEVLREMPQEMTQQVVKEVPKFQSLALRVTNGSVGSFWTPKWGEVMWV